MCGGWQPDGHVIKTLSLPLSKSQPTVPIHHNKYVSVTLTHPPAEATASLLEHCWAPREFWKSTAQVNRSDITHTHITQGLNWQNLWIIGGKKRTVWNSTNNSSFFRNDLVLRVVVTVSRRTQSFHLHYRFRTQLTPNKAGSCGDVLGLRSICIDSRSIRNSIMHLKLENRKLSKNEYRPRWCSSVSAFFRLIYLRLYFHLKNSSVSIAIIL